MERKLYIGGSDAASVLGISPWRTPLDLYLEKTDQEEREEPNEVRQKVLTRGKRLEPYICDMLQSEHGAILSARNKRYVDSELPYLAAEIDAETASGENVEIKTVHPFRAKDWGPDNSDSVPTHYVAQAMHGLMVTGRDVCIFAALIGDDLRLYRVERDVDVIRGMREREIEFWERHVIPRVPPLPTSAADALRLFPKDNGAVVEATQDVLMAVYRLASARHQAKELEEHGDAEEARIKAFMGDAATLVSADGEVLCTWKSQTARRLDQKALTAAHPEIVEQFKTATASRVFRLK